MRLTITKKMRPLKSILFCKRKNKRKKEEGKRKTKQIKSSSAEIFKAREFSLTKRCPLFPYFMLRLNSSSQTYFFPLPVS
jgi:hypothetical protein